MNKQQILLSVFLLCFLISAFVFNKPLNTFAQSTSGNIATTVGGLIIRNPENKNGIASTLYFLKGVGGPSANNIIGQISAYVIENNPASSALQFYSNNRNKPTIGLTIMPDGSLFAGGFSDKNTPDSATKTDRLPSLTASSPEKSRGIYDFYFGTLLNDPGTSPRLYTRSLILTERRDPPDLTLRRTGPDNGTLYGAPKQVEAGASLGTIRWSGYSGDDYHGEQALIYARAENGPQDNNGPGSLYFGTTPKNADHAVDRMSIKSDGKIAMNKSSEPLAQLDVGGDIKTAGCPGCADLAEDYQSNEQLEAGDLVVIDDQAQNLSVKRSSVSFDQKLVGVVSSTPAVRISESGGIFLSKGDNSKSADGYPVALSGRVPVKVSVENGPIKPGDFLTSSTTPGVAMKADKKGAVVGKALESYSKTGVGKIKMLVNVAYYAP